MASVPDAVPQQRLQRYNNGAVLLHWLTALVVVAQVVVGFVFAAMERGPARGELFTVHKTIGATILVLALIRLGRVMTRQAAARRRGRWPVPSWS